MRNKVVIWGAKDLGRYAIRELKNEGHEIVAVIDNCAEIQGTKIEGISIISPENMRHGLCNDNSTLILTVMNSKSVYEVLEQVEEFRFQNIGILKPRAGKYGLRILLASDEIGGEIIWYIRGGKREQIIPRLEINLIDNCNLNCVGCTHFSSIYEEKSIIPYSQFVEELKQIRKIGKFVRLRLLGGEPLLVPTLGQYIRVARELFPEADIEIVTNGLLIPKLNEELLEEIKACKISMVITPYRPTMQLMEKIRQIFNLHEVWWNFDGELVTEFSRQFTLDNNHNGHEASKKCISSGCLFLRNGKIYKCPIAGLANDFARFYHIAPVPETGIDIYDDPQMVYEKLKDCAKNPTAICNYCSEEMERIPWTVGRNICLDDWLYHEGNMSDKEKIK